MSRRGIQPLNPEQELQFQAWRAAAISPDKGMPYMASMLFSMTPVSAPGLGTMAIDPQHRVYIDFEACPDKGFDWCVTGLLHEAMHLFLDHSARADHEGVRDNEKDLSNVAADCELNDDLRDAGFDVSGDFTPDRIGQPDYGTFEEYLAHLRAARARQKARQSAQGGDGAQGKDQSPQSGQGAAGNPQDDQDGKQADGGGDSPDQEPFAGCGSGSGGLPAPVELDLDDDMDGNAPGLSGPEKELVQISVAASVSEHSSSGRGNIPAGLKQWAEHILAPPKIPWQQTLSAHVRRSLSRTAGDDDVSYSRRDRRRRSPGIIFPGTESPELSICVVRDTSGSMGAGELNDAMNEIVGISKSLDVQGENLQVIDCDTQTYGAVRYDRPDSIAEVQGRGGTDMVAGINEAHELRPNPSVIVVITDGGTPWPGEPTRIPVVACIVGNDSFRSPVPNWIASVYTED